MLAKPSQERGGSEYRTASILEREAFTRSINLLKAVRPHPGFVGGIFFISPRNGTRTKVFETLPAFLCICGRALLRGVVQPYFQWAHWATRRGFNVRVGSMGKLIWNFMVHPLLGEEDFALSPRWL